MTRSAYVWVPVLIAATVGVAVGGPIGLALLESVWPSTLGAADTIAGSLNLFFIGMQMAPLSLAAVWLAWGGSPLALRVLGFVIAGATLIWNPLGVLDLGMILQMSWVSFLLSVVALMPPFRQRVFRVSRDRLRMDEQAFPWRFSIRQLLLVTAVLAVAAAGLRQTQDFYWNWDSLKISVFASFALPVMPVCWVLLRPQFSLWRCLAVSMAAASLTALLGLLLMCIEMDFDELLAFISDPVSYANLFFFAGIAGYVWVPTLIVRQMGYRVARAEAIVPTPQV